MKKAVLIFNPVNLFCSKYALPVKAGRAGRFFEAGFTAFYYR
jgi:hypothetical protein